MRRKTGAKRNPTATSGTPAYRAGHRAYYSGYARDAALRLYLKSLMGMDLHGKLSAKREFVQGWDAVASGVLREVTTRRRTANPAARNGRSYIVKGEIPKRYWEPAQGEVVYIEGTRTKLGKPYQDGGSVMFPLHPPIRGTTDMSAGNIKAIARVEKVSNPRRGTVHDIPSTWTPAKVKRVGRGVQIRMRGR